VNFLSYISHGLLLKTIRRTVHIFVDSRLFVIWQSH